MSLTYSETNQSFPFPTEKKRGEEEETNITDQVYFY